MYIVIMTTLKEEQIRECMSFQKALKYVILQNRLNTHKKLALITPEAENSESDSEAENPESNAKLGLRYVSIPKTNEWITIV